MNLQPAILLPAAYITVQIQSFDGQSVCAADIELDINIPTEQCRKILSPEEAEAIGINIFHIKDVGNPIGQSLGDELNDWRLFSQHSISEMRDMGNGHIWIQPAKKAVFINPRIQGALSQAVLSGQSLLPMGFENPPKQVKLTENLSIIPAHLRSEPIFQRQIQRAQTPIDAQGIAEDWTACILYRQTRRAATRIANFIPLPVRREYQFDVKGGRKLFYTLRVHMYGQYPQDLVISEDELSHINRAVQRVFDSATVSSPKAACDLENYVRERLAPLPPAGDCLKLVSPGWQVLSSEQVVYVFDNRPAIAPFIFASGRTLIMGKMDAESLWRCFTEMLSVSRDPHITAPMVLFSIMGMLFTVFEQANFPLQFALYVVGTTGSLKTSLSEALFQVFNLEGNAEKHTFSDTMASVEKYIGMLKDEVGLIDDLELGDDAAETARQKSIFSFILRLVGDGKGKSRSNSALADVKGTPSHGLVAMTGEQSLGKQSTRLRMVEVEVTKGAISGERLAIFQDNPYRWASVCGMFLSYVEQNYRDVREGIARKSRELRREYQAKYQHLRTVDQLIAFRLTAELLRNFWSLNIQRPEEVNAIIELMIRSVEEILSCAANRDEVENPGIRFLVDLDAMLGTKQLLLANSAENFTFSGDVAGFLDSNSDLILLKDRSYSAVRDYEAQMRRRFAFDMTKILKSLDELGAVVSFKNGGCNRTYSLRKNGKTFVQIRGDRFKEIVEKNS